MIRRLSIAIVLMATACAQSPKPPKEVVVTVSRSCVPPNLPATPDPQSYPDTRDNLLGMNEGPERYAALFAGNLLRKDRLDVLEPVIESCR